MDIPEPSPDFEGLLKVLSGEVDPDRAWQIELGIDIDAMKAVTETVFGEEWPPGEEISVEAAWARFVRFYHRMGYHCVPIGIYGLKGFGEFKARWAPNTAELATRDRHWIEEGYGTIRSWEDFDALDWDAGYVDTEPFDLAAKYLPEGMKICAISPMFEHVLERFLGFEGLFYLVHDDFELVRAVFEQVGRMVEEFYAKLAGRGEIGALCTGDDLGYKTGPMLSPDVYRELVFPWYRRYARIAHEAGKPCWLHSCGNKAQIMEDIIDIGFDALHSFEDVIMPVAEVKRRYGDRIAILGGVDMDKLARLPEDELRRYVRGILNDCVPGGRYALGAGNSVANYVPVRNYLAMLDEGWRWRP